MAEASACSVVSSSPGYQGEMLSGAVQLAETSYGQPIILHLNKLSFFNQLLFFDLALSF